MKIKMKPIFTKHLLFFLLICSGSMSLFSQNDTSKVDILLQKANISGQWFLANQHNITDNLNKFYLKRGYFTIKTDLNPQISVRYTQDITLDKEGSDAGNVEIRMKYLFMKIKPFKTGFMQNSYAEVGLIPRPWLEFEQKINDYRSQGQMYLEKSGIINSADFGIMYSGLIGGKLDKSIQKKIGKHHPGKYGSYSLGIYNGAGYHDIELNSNKTIEGRISIRPFPEFIPGLQLTYSGAFGKANRIVDHENFNLHLLYLSYESAFFTLTGQYYKGKGDTYGNYYIIDYRLPSSSFADKNSGFSFFGEFKIPKTPLSVFSRYDNFNSQNPLAAISMNNGYFAGVTYRFMKNKLFAYYGQDKNAGEKSEVFELVLEVVF